ncbi:MAG: hypothetical protein ACJATG_001930, partial [Dinoroseobacter sp.]
SFCLRSILRSKKAILRAENTPGQSNGREQNASA